MFIVRHRWTGLSCWPITHWSPIIGVLEIFLEVNNRGGGVIGNFCRDVGFTESSMLYANLSHLSYQNKNSMLDVQYLVSEKCHTFT